jgi:hypothetical protein
MHFKILHQNNNSDPLILPWLKNQGYVDENESNISSKQLGNSPNESQVASAFEELVDWIEAEIEENIIGRSSVTDFLIIVSLPEYSVRQDDFNPIKLEGWTRVIGMLILAFPEVRWFFPEVTATKEWRGKDGDCLTLHFSLNPAKWNDAFNLLCKGLTSLFDSTGLRDTIREAISLDFNLPRRHQLAIAIDDERNYSWLHAYTAYRFGFRAQAISTLSGMDGLLNKPYPEPTLIFEDYFLQFSDKHPSNFSCLRKRDKLYPRLQQADFRILITSGHHHGQDKETIKDNSCYLSELRTKGKWIKELHKPLGGIFNLWKDSGLQSKLCNGGRQGLASGFESPPKKLQDNMNGHSAPGRLLVIAERLIARAERLLSSGVHSIPQAVYGAVLATDALELLGGKTPTTSLQALALKHHFEVLAECQFVGTQEHMDVEGRMDDIQCEITALCYWFGAKSQQKNVASWNAELAILNRLITVFREYNQFDEEQTILVRTRKLHRELRFTKYPFWKKLLLYPFGFRIFSWYANEMVASVNSIFIAIMFWIGTLGSLFHFTNNDIGWGRGFTYALSTFLGLSSRIDDCIWKPEDGWNGIFYLVAVTISLGFIHLGIFVSHLYSIISRK